MFIRYYVYLPAYSAQENSCKFLLDYVLMQSSLEVSYLTFSKIMSFVVLYWLISGVKIQLYLELD